MTIKEFLEKAIEGGWKYKIGITKRCTSISYSPSTNTFKTNYGTIPIPPLALIVLDPKSWEAVGKVERWEENSINNIVYTKGYQYKMNGLMPHLQEGGTIESYIETL